MRTIFRSLVEYLQEANRPVSGLRTRALYLRLLGLVSLVAIGSFWSQLSGLIGSHGIWPVEEQLSWFRASLGSQAPWQLPTIAWWFHTDGALHGLAMTGVLLALLALLGLGGRWVFLLLWGMWLSLVNVGGPFLSFQWDLLLLESLLLAVFYAPSSLGRARIEPWGGALWLQRFLIFKFMLLNGLVKVLSGDPSWRDLTAFQFHYWTQPLPTWSSYLLHQLPLWLHRAMCAVVLVVELAVPWLVFAPRPARLGAFAAFSLLQVGMMAAGNYSYFNLLTLVLCVPLLDDRALPRLTPTRWRGSEVVGEASHHRLRLAAVLVALPWGLLSAAAGAQRVFPAAVPSVLARVLAGLAPLKSVNGYGAFAVMTRTRPEIEVEGSYDGVSWTPYVFHHKPGRLDRRPTFIAPLQPRLDWQMWFAALGQCQNNPWFVRLLHQLFLNAEPVVGLMAENPFAQSPPRFLRSTVYQYRFSELGRWRTEGVWWERTLQGPYCPTLTLHEGVMREAGP